MAKKSDPNNPDDWHPPEEAERRTRAVLRTCLGVPPADEEEKLLRQKIAREWSAIYDRDQKHK